MCDFEDEVANIPAQCNFTVDGAGLWQVSAGPTDTQGTGPAHDLSVGDETGTRAGVRVCVWIGLVGDTEKTQWLR